MKKTDPSAGHKTGGGKHPQLSQLRNLFFTGLFVTVPVFLTFWLLQWAFNKLDGPFRTFLESHIEQQLDYQPGTVHLYGVGLVILVVIILFVGVVAKLYAGKLAIRMLEALLGRVPVVSKVYHAIKQITDSVLGEKKGAMYSAVMIEFPRPGLWALGFYTGDVDPSVVNSVGSTTPLKYVFLPTTPNPTSGYLLMVPADKVYIVPMAVDDAIKLIVSGGAVSAGLATTPLAAPGKSIEPA